MTGFELPPPSFLAGLVELDCTDRRPWAGIIASVSLPPLEIGLTPWDFGPGGLAAGLVGQAEQAEKLGFHSLWLPEHHFSGRGAIPSPLLLLAAVAARTTKLRLGTTSYLLPLRHPIHVAEEVAVLDQLSNGRVILGLGRGFRKGTFAAFDVPVKEKRSRFEAALEVMLAAWAGEPVAWEGDGDGGPGEPVILAPPPVQKPHPPLWVAAFGPKAMAQAGRLGLPYLASPIESWSRLEENHARHREACDAAGKPVPDVVPVMRTIFVHENPATLDRARQALEAQAAAMARSGRLIPRDGNVALEDWALVGEPKQVADGIARYRERFGMTHLIARSPIPGVDPAELEASLELTVSLR